MNLSDNLKKIRKDNNLSQEQLAEKLGVSRQSVSKWENGEAYPEMDKVLQICKMFNLNIDELLNQDIKEVNEAKQSKINIDKYVSDFLDYVTKTINLFSSLKFKDKIKCLFEQIVIAFALSIVGMIVGLVGSNLVSGIFFFIPPSIYYDVYNLFSGLYFVFVFIVSAMLMLHIFRVRYLDYFVVVEDESVNAKTSEEVVQSNDSKSKDDKVMNKNIFFSRKDEKVIIRDPKHSKNSFISLLVRSILFMIKCFVFCVELFFSISLVCLVFSFVLLFLFVRTGLTFIGILFVVIAGIIVNLIILNLIYNFLKSIKSKTRFLMIMFIVSLILVGVGSGLFCIGLLNFNCITADESNYLIETNQRLEMNDGYYIEHWDSIEFIESDNDDLKFVYLHPSFYNIEYVLDGSGGIWFNDYYINGIDIINMLLEDINNKKIIKYGNYSVKVYTSKANIEKLKINRSNYYDRINQNDLRNYYERKIEDLENYIVQLETESCFE